MLQIRRDFDLAQESLDANDGAEVGLEHLQRNSAIMPDVAREVHRCHAAFADKAFNGVSASEGGVELFGCGHEARARVRGLSCGLASVLSRLMGAISARQPTIGCRRGATTARGAAERATSALRRVPSTLALSSASK